MTVYCFNTYGYFTGLSDCPLDPRATDRLGEPRYLVPPDATETAPPEFDQDTQKARWNGETWEVEDITKATDLEPDEPKYTDLQLLAQQVTDLELMMLGGERNV